MKGIAHHRDIEAVRSGRVRLLALILAALATTSASAADSLAQLTAKYYEAAKKEGSLVIYGLGPPFLAPIVEAFNKRYPGIQVEAFDESGRATQERVIAEHKTARVVGDVLIGGPSLHQGLNDLGLIEPYQSPQIPQMIPELVPEGGFANPLKASVTSMAINTKA